MTVRGLDVSSYQEEHYGLRGADFVFVKATEGTSYINPKQWRQASWARASGAVVGWYHFLRPGNMRAQATYFVEKCGSIPGDPLWADWEDAGVSCADKDEFLREVIRLRGDTHRVGLYCNTNFWLHHDTTSYAADALWIAQYNGRPGRPSIQARWLFHQYTSDPIDTSVGRFADRAALRRWAEGDDHDDDQEAKTMTLDLTQNVPVPQWAKDLYSDDEALQNGVWLQTALGSGYAHSRRAHDAAAANARALKVLAAKGGARDALLQQLLGLVEKLGADGGLTVQEIEAASAAGARAALAELGHALAGEQEAAA